MKIACLGDIHSRPIWKDVVDHIFDDVDKIILLGDYVDPYKYEFKEQIDSFKILSDVIELKNKYPEKIINIIGNHDAHYLFNDIQPCSRYDRDNASAYRALFNINKHLFQYAYQVENHLFTHAGISNDWFELFEDSLKSFGLIDKYNIADVLNTMGNDKIGNRILNSVGYIRGGDCNAGGIVWSDYSETCRDFLVGIHQYAGHTKVKYIHTEKNETGSITYCDVLATPNENMKYNYHLVNV